jgi:hypothetical protein
MGTEWVESQAASQGPGRGRVGARVPHLSTRSPHSGRKYKHKHRHSILSQTFYVDKLPPFSLESCTFLQAFLSIILYFFSLFSFSSWLHLVSKSHHLSISLCALYKQLYMLFNTTQRAPTVCQRAGDNKKAKPCLIYHTG